MMTRYPVIRPMNDADAVAFRSLMGIGRKECSFVYGQRRIVMTHVGRSTPPSQYVMGHMWVRSV